MIDFVVYLPTSTLTIMFFPFQHSIRRIYFSDRLYTEEELPAEFKLFLPLATDPSSAASVTNATTTGAVAAADKKKQEEVTETLSKTVETDKSFAEGKEHEEKTEDKENSAENAAVTVNRPESISTAET